MKLLQSLFCLFVVLCIVGIVVGAPICHSTGQTPRIPKGLDTCYMYSSKACCLPGYDRDYIRAAYMNIIPLGGGCRAGSQTIRAVFYDILRYLCLPCNPKEPLYRFESIKGDIVDGGIVPPSPQSKPGEYTWRICHSFLYGKPGSNEGIWGRNADHYEKCGINLQMCPATPLFDIATQEFEEPPEKCPIEPRVVIPSVAFEGATDPALQMLLHIAQSALDFQIVVVNDSDPKYNFAATPCFGKNAAYSYSLTHAVLLFALSVASAFF